MTPKEKANEKANELINKFLEYAEIECDDDGFPMATSQIKNAKQCALIAVDEIINNDDPVNYYMTEEGLRTHYGALKTIDNFWFHVKQEIQKL